MLLNQTTKLHLTNTSNKFYLVLNCWVRPALRAHCLKTIWWFTNSPILVNNSWHKTGWTVAVVIDMATIMSLGVRIDRDCNSHSQSWHIWCLMSSLWTNRISFCVGLPIALGRVLGFQLIGLSNWPVQSLVLTKLLSSTVLFSLLAGLRNTIL